MEIPFVIIYYGAYVLFVLHLMELLFFFCREKVAGREKVMVKN